MKGPIIPPFPWIEPGVNPPPMPFIPGSWGSITFPTP